MFPLLAAVALTLLQPPTPADIIKRQDVEFLIRHGVKSPPAKTPGAVRIATYNIENLFDDKDDPNLSGQYEDLDDATLPDRLAAIAETIHLLDADILAVEEIESLETLTWFRDTYLADLGYEHIASLEAGDERGIEQAVLSRFPITNAQNWPHMALEGVHPPKWGRNTNDRAGQPILFHRSPLQVDIEIPGDAGPYRLTLFVVHHKSGRDGDYWREAETKGVSRLIADLAKRDSSRNILLLGDFNAEATAKSVKTYFEMGLQDVFAGQFEPEAISHASNRRIDMILYNSAIEPELRLDSRFVLGTPARDSSASYRDPPPPGYASDHYPVALDLVPVETGENPRPSGASPVGR